MARVRYGKLPDGEREARRRARRLERGRDMAATAEVEYSDEEREFLVAVDRWKCETGTRFPTLTQLLGVLKSLGYRRPGA
jgi:hypothetical protein